MADKTREGGAGAEGPNCLDGACERCGNPVKGVIADKPKDDPVKSGHVVTYDCPNCGFAGRDVLDQITEVTLGA